MRQTSKLMMLLVVAVTWFMMTFFYTVGNLVVLVPWDVAIAQPDVGTWQRTLNDFFEAPFGEMLLFIFISIITVLPIIRTLLRRWDAHLKIIIANLLALCIGWFMMIVSFLFSKMLFPLNGDFMDPYSQNYTRSIIPLITIWLCYVIWFRKIRDLGKPSRKVKNKAKNESYQNLVTQLTDGDMIQETSSDYQETKAFGD